jgi:hypothetical protein
MIWTAAKMTPYILRLLTGRPSYRTDASETTIDSSSRTGIPAMAEHIDSKGQKDISFFVSNGISSSGVGG